MKTCRVLSVILIFLLVGFSAISAQKISLKDIDNLFAQKKEMSDIQWETTQNNLLGCSISLSGEVLDVEEKGWIYKKARIYLKGEQDGIKFYAVCDSSIEIGLLLTKGRKYQINGIIDEVKYRSPVNKSTIFFGLGPSLILKLFGDKPIIAYLLKLEGTEFGK